MLNVLSMVNSRRIQDFLPTIAVFLPVVVCSFQLLDYSLIPRYLLLCFFSCVFSWLVFKDQFIHCRYIVRITPLRILMVVWLCACMVSVINTSLYGEYLFEVLRVGLYLVFFLFLCKLLQRGFNIDWFLRLSVLMTIALCVIGGYQFHHYKAEVTIRGMEQVTGLMSNKNLFAEYLAILFPFITYSFVIHRRVWKFLSAIAIFLSAAFLMILLGRAAWMGLLIAGLLAMVVGFGMKAFNVLTDKQRRTFFIWGAVLLVVVILIASYFDSDVFTNRFLSIFNVDEERRGGRLKVWQLTWQMIKEEPWLGIGLGSWKIAFQEFGFSRQPLFTIEPLNDYLGIFAEAGVFGFFAYGGMLTFGLVQLIRMSVARRVNSGFYLATASSLVVFSVVSFFNFPIHRVEHSTLMIFALAVADSNSQSVSVKHGKRFGLLSVGALLIFSLVSGCVGMLRYISEKNTRSALEARIRNDWPAVIASCDKVFTDIYPFDPTTTPILWYRGIAYFKLGEIEQASTDFQDAYRINPYHVHVINNLATCHAMTGDLNRAIQLYREAIEIDEYFLDAVVNLIAVYEHVGDYTQIQELINNSPLYYTPELIEIRLRLRKDVNLDV